jgi:hypothetical protein
MGVIIICFSLIKTAFQIDHPGKSCIVYRTPKSA